MNKSIIGAIALILMISTGCGENQDEIVAQVGSKTVTLGQVVDYDKYFPRRYSSAEEEYEAKRRHVDSLIDLRLLVIGAYQNDLDIDQEVMRIVEIEKPRFLLDELFKKEILTKTMVSDGEVQDFYDKLKEEIHVKHILVEEEALCDSLYQEIVGGAEFGQLARDFSLDQASAMNGGDLGYIRWGQFPNSFQDVVFGISPGQTSRPFETDFGWHLVQVADKRESDPGSFDELEPRIRAQIQASKRQEVMGEYIEGLSQKVEIRLDEEVYQGLLDQMNRVYPDTLGGKPFVKSMIDLALLEEYQKSQILAYFNGGETTVEDYMTAINQVPIGQRPDFKDREGVRAAVFNMNMQQFLTNEAESEGIDKTESFETVLMFFKETVMADKMRELVMQGIPPVVDDDIYDYYEKNINEFDVPKRLHVREIMVNEQAVAESLRTLIDGGASFAELAGEHTVRPGMKERQGDLGFFEPYRYPSIYKAAENMRVDEIKGPVALVGSNWSILKLEGVEPPITRPIEEVAGDIKSELTLKRQTETLDNWLEARKAETTITVDYDLIWKSIDEGKYETP